MEKKDFPPLHPGEVLEQEFLVPLKLSQHKLALGMQVSPQKINRYRTWETRNNGGYSHKTRPRVGNNS